MYWKGIKDENIGAQGKLWVTLAGENVPKTVDRNMVCAYEGVYVRFVKLSSFCFFCFGYNKR